MSTDYEYHALRPRYRWRGLLMAYLSNVQGSVVGVDGCPAGWVCFHVDMQTRSTSVVVISKISELISASPRPILVGIDIPIGLPQKGPRACDMAARRLLGKPRSSSVFPAPVRATLVARNYEEACDLTGLLCTSRREREFTRRTAGYAKQEVQSGTDRNVATPD